MHDTIPGAPDAEDAALPTAPFYMPTAPRSNATLMLQAFQLANAAVISDIESEGVAVQLDGRTWYDIRPMTDQREHSPPVVDMAVQAIAYAVGSGLAGVHPQMPYLLHIHQRG